MGCVYPIHTAHTGLNPKLIQVDTGVCQLVSTLYKRYLTACIVTSHKPQAPATWLTSQSTPQTLHCTIVHHNGVTRELIQVDTHASTSPEEKEVAPPTPGSMPGTSVSAFPHPRPPIQTRTLFVCTPEKRAGDDKNRIQLAR